MTIELNGGAQSPKEFILKYTIYPICKPRFFTVGKWLSQPCDQLTAIRSCICLINNAY